MLQLTNKFIWSCYLLDNYEVYKKYFIVSDRRYAPIIDHRWFEQYLQPVSISKRGCLTSVSESIRSPSEALRAELRVTPGPSLRQASLHRGLSSWGSAPYPRWWPHWGQLGQFFWWSCYIHCPHQGYFWTIYMVLWSLKWDNLIDYVFVFFFFFLAALGLRSCARAFSSCGARGLLFIAVRGLLIAVAALVAEHGL